MTFSILFDHTAWTNDFVVLVRIVLKEKPLKFNPPNKPAEWIPVKNKSTWLSGACVYLNSVGDVRLREVDDVVQKPEHRPTKWFLLNARTTSACKEAWKRNYDKLKVCSKTFGIDRTWQMGRKQLWANWRLFILKGAKSFKANNCSWGTQTAEPGENRASQPSGAPTTPS